MSAIPYAAPIVNTTFTCVVGTRQEIVTGLETALTAAGWSTISGGGTGDVLMKSAVTPAPKSNSTRVRLFDSGAGNASVYMLDDSGLLVSWAYSLIPAAGKTFRVIACPYNFAIMVDGSTVASNFLMLGTLFIPDFLNGVITADLGFACGDNDPFRTSTRAAHTTGMCNGSIFNVDGFGAATNVTLSYFSTAWGVALQVPWHDGSLTTYQAEVSFSRNGAETIRTRGLIHNAMLVRGQFPLDDVSIVNYDGHAWRVISAYGAIEIALALAIS